jgi:hypothetical protein
MHVLITEMCFKVPLVGQSLRLALPRGDEGGDTSTICEPLATRAGDVWSAPFDVPCVTLDAFCAERDLRQVDLMLVDIEGAEIAAETLTVGDPSFAGPLAGVSLGLPIYHILEPDVKAAVPEDVYEESAWKLLGINVNVTPAEKTEGSHRMPNSNNWYKPRCSILP